MYFPIFLFFRRSFVAVEFSFHRFLQGFYLFLGFLFLVPRWNSIMFRNSISTNWKLGNPITIRFKYFVILVSIIRIRSLFHCRIVCDCFGTSVKFFKGSLANKKGNFDKFKKYLRPY